MEFRPANGPPIDWTPFRLSIYKYVGTIFGTNVRELFQNHYASEAQNFL